MTAGPPNPALGIPAPSFLTVEQAHHGLRADAFLALSLPSLSRTRIRQKIQTGESLLNGRRYATSARLKTGDTLTVHWRSLPAVGSGRQFEILYQDEHIIALDKPAGAASHPAGRYQADTVIQFLRERFAADLRASLSEAGDFFLSLVNRLDVFTSGVILAAKTVGALRAMLELAARGEISKRYVALVEGVAAWDERRIDLPLGPDRASVTTIRVASREDGLASITDCRVLRRMKRHTLLAVFPRTGRQHQVRAHLAAIGHPVWGDLLYKDESRFLEYQRGENDSPRAHPRAGGPSFPLRHCLHAEESRFVHPFTGADMVIRSPLPPDFLGILQGLEGQA